jgi:hypothetical protein
MVRPPHLQVETEWWNVYKRKNIRIVLMGTVTHPLRMHKHVHLRENISHFVRPRRPESYGAKP